MFAPAPPQSYPTPKILSQTQQTYICPFFCCPTDEIETQSAETKNKNIKLSIRNINSQVGKVGIDKPYQRRRQSLHNQTKISLKLFAKERKDHSTMFPQISEAPHFPTSGHIHQEHSNQTHQHFECTNEDISKNEKANDDIEQDFNSIFSQSNQDYQYPKENYNKLFKNKEKVPLKEQSSAYAHFSFGKRNKNPLKQKYLTFPQIPLKAVKQDLQSDSSKEHKGSMHRQRSLLNLNTKYIYSESAQSKQSLIIEIGTSLKKLSSS